MLLTVPVSKSDAHLIPFFQKALEKFPPGANHNLLIVASPSAKIAAEELLFAIRGHFVNSTIEVFGTDNLYDWPRACNYYFQQACYIVPKYAKPNQGWLWCELDSVPMGVNWLSIIEQSYYSDSTIAHQQGREMARYMGTKERTIKQYAGELAEGGEHMASVGVYPADFAAICPVLKSIASSGTPFSAHIKWYPLKSFHDNPLFQNNRETINYRLEDGKIASDSVSRNAYNLHWNNPISDGAILLHGCKDGSLIEVLPENRTVVSTGGAISVAAPKTAPKPPQQFVPEPEIPKNQSITTPQNTPVIGQSAPGDISTLLAQQEDGSHLLSSKPTTPTQVMKFGQHMETTARFANVQFDASGKPIVPEAAPVIPTPEPARPEPKRGRRMKRTWTPEQKAAAGERMRQMHINRKARQQTAVPA